MGIFHWNERKQARRACLPHVCLGFFSLYFQSLPQSLEMHIRLIGDSKVPLGVSVCVNAVCAM